MAEYDPWVGRLAYVAELEAKRERLFQRILKAKKESYRLRLQAEYERLGRDQLRWLYMGCRWWQLAEVDDPVGELEDELEREARKVWQCSFCEVRFEAPTRHYAIGRVECPGSPGFKAEW